MKKIIALLVTTVIIFLALENIELSKRKNSNDEYSYLEYVITEIHGNEYFGESIINENEGIYFTSEDIAENSENIEVDDTIKAYFEKQDLNEFVYTEKIP